MSAKLPHILKWTAGRQENAELYDKHLAGIAQIKTPKVRPGTKHSYHLYVIRAQNRDGLAAHLKQHNIETAVHYPTPLPLLPCYQYLGHSANDFPIASELQHEILSLPMYPEMTEEMIQHVASVIKGFYA